MSLPPVVSAPESTLTVSPRRVPRWDSAGWVLGGLVALPFAGLFGWSGAGMSDLADLGLAMNAAALGLHDEADRHFAEGIAICERAGTRSYLARFHFFWTVVLADRSDVVRAREQGEIAIALGTELGMTGPQGVVPRAQAILAAL